MRAIERFFRPALFLAVAASILAAPLAHAATIIIQNNDGAGEGFNDATPAAPVGGNPGVTIGAQRLYVFQYAANIWGALLPSSVTIVVNSQFNPLTCSATSGVLGSAGPTTVHRDFVGAPVPGHWYYQALANRLFGADLNANNDINATFSSTIGSATCLGGQPWYYGVDGNEGGGIELLPVVLHELGHGLGFSTQTSGTTGNYLSTFPTIFDRFLLDNVTGTHWDTNTAAQRVASAISCGKLVWDGPAVTYASAGYLGPKPVLTVNGGPAAGDYNVGLASFGPQSYSITGDVVYVDDGVAAPSINDGCESPFVNAGALAGKIALIDRGTCGFVVKVKNAQDNGAIAVIIADNAAGCPPAGLGGADPTITIPSVRVTQTDGNTLKANLVGLNVTMGFDPSKNAGADNLNHVQMYTPNPFQSGSSVSHWDTATEPNTLMEPAINTSLSSTVDLTLNLMSDIGWFDIAVPVQVAPGHVFAEEGHIQVEFYTSEALSRNWTAFRRESDGDWMSLGTPQTMGTGLLLVDDNDVVAGKRYAYRVGSPGENGEMEYSGEVWATVPSNLVFALKGARPNPAMAGPVAVTFSLPNSSPARLELVNVAGRIMQTKEVGSLGAGTHTIPLDLSGSLRSGVYFVTLTQGTKTLKSPVVVVK